MGEPRTPKHLRLLGATEDDVSVEYATIVYQRAPSPTGAQRVFVETFVDAAPKTKQHAKLGVPAEQPLAWLARRGSTANAEMETTVVRSKALKMLGATIDDVRIEKALLVMGEAPGRQVPAGAVPRPDYLVAARESRWAEPPAPPAGLSVFILACLPWAVLAPLNLLQLQLGGGAAPGALARLVLDEAEAGQLGCGVGRMWAMLFWSMQAAGAVACAYLHFHRERGLALLLACNKLAVGALLLKAFAEGVVVASVGCVGGALELAFAALFVRELRRR